MQQYRSSADHPTENGYLQAAEKMASSILDDSGESGEADFWVEAFFKVP